MSGDVHVRFCESLGLQRPGPLTPRKQRAACKRQARKQYAKSKQANDRKKG
jgi:hypothetical protein